MAESAIAWNLVGILSLTGIVMGLFVAFGVTRDTLWGEFLAWTIFAVPWIATVLVLGLPRPFLHLALAGVLSGVLFGATTQVFWDSYLEHNPETFVEPTIEGGQDPEGAGVRATNAAFALVIGLVWGALVGAVAAALARIRRGPELPTV